MFQAGMVATLQISSRSTEQKEQEEQEHEQEHEQEQKEHLVCASSSTGFPVPVS